MDGQASISSEVLARYAADAALEIDGVRGLVASQLHRHRGVRVSGEDGAVTIEVHLDVHWGAPLPAVGHHVQRHVLAYLQRVLGARADALDAVSDPLDPADGRRP